MRSGSAIVTLMVAALAWNSAGAAVTLGGHHLALDTLSATLLCSVPREVFGTDFTAVVGDDATDGIPWTHVTINGKAVTEGGTVTFANVGPLSRYPLTATTPTGTIKADIAFTFLPVLDFDGTIVKTYTLHPFRLLLPEGGDLSLQAKVKFRGGYTNQPAFAKRHYHVKFVDDDGSKLNISQLGIRTDNSWLLDGGCADLLRIRNRVLTDLWLDMATPPYYATLAPEAHTGVRGRMVEVIRDNEYQGVYNLCENADRKMAGLVRYDDDRDQIHGLLYKEKSRSPQTLMTGCDTPDNLSMTWGGTEAKYPEFDDIGRTDWGPLRDLVDLTANADDAHFAARISILLDLPAMADYYVFLQTVLGFDNMGKNVCWACHDATVSRRLTPIVWDLDATLGQSWNLSLYHPTYLGPTRDLLTNFGDNTSNLLLRLVAVNPNGFNQRCTRRFHQLAPTLLNADSVAARFDAYLAELSNAGAIHRERQRWLHTADLYGRTPFPDDELPFIRQWLEQRFAYLAENIFNTETEYGDINGDGTIDINDINTLISMQLGRIPHNDAADLNHDGCIDVQDLRILIDLLLHIGR